MCDYSLRNVRSRPAAVGDKLITRDFGSGTHGFGAVKTPISPSAFCPAPSWHSIARSIVFRRACCHGATG
jgi:hypothetical protein